MDGLSVGRTAGLFVWSWGRGWSWRVVGGIGWKWIKSGREVDFYVSSGLQVERRWIWIGVVEVRQGRVGGGVWVDWRWDGVAGVEVEWWRDCMWDRWWTRWTGGVVPECRGTGGGRVGLEVEWR